MIQFQTFSKYDLNATISIYFKCICLLELNQTISRKKIGVAYSEQLLYNGQNTAGSEDAYLTYHCIVINVGSVIRTAVGRGGGCLNHKGDMV